MTSESRAWENQQVVSGRWRKRMRNKEMVRGKDRDGKKAREAQSVQGGERRGRGNLGNAGSWILVVLRQVRQRTDG